MGYLSYFLFFLCPEKYDICLIQVNIIVSGQVQLKPQYIIIPVFHITYRLNHTNLKRSFPLQEYDCQRTTVLKQTYHIL